MMVTGRLVERKPDAGNVFWSSRIAYVPLPKPYYLQKQLVLPSYFSLEIAKCITALLTAIVTIICIKKSAIGYTRVQNCMHGYSFMLLLKSCVCQTHYKQHIKRMMKNAKIRKNKKIGIDYRLYSRLLSLISNRTGRIQVEDLSEFILTGVMQYRGTLDSGRCTNYLFLNVFIQSITTKFELKMFVR